jgi:sec-independent protein translocase protein TatA
VFGLSFWEIAIILAIALIILGPKKLPEIARSMGKGLKEFRKATEDFKSTMDAELHADDKAAAKKKLPEPAAEQIEDQAKAAAAEAEIVAEIEKAKGAESKG